MPIVNPSTSSVSVRDECDLPVRVDEVNAAPVRFYVPRLTQFINVRLALPPSQRNQEARRVSRWFVIPPNSINSQVQDSVNRIICPCLACTFRVPSVPTTRLERASSLQPPRLERSE